MTSKVKWQLLSAWVALITSPAFVHGLRRLLHGSTSRIQPHFAPEAVRRILVHRMDALGDTALTLPLLQSLRDHWPEAHITYAAQPRAVSLLKCDSRVDALLAIQTGGPFSLVRRVMEWWHAARAGAAEGYDLAVLPRWGHDEYGCAVQSVLLGAAWIVGHRLGGRPSSWSCGTRCDYLLSQAVDGATGHEVEKSLHLLQEIGVKAAMEVAPIGVSQQIEKDVEQWLDSHGVGRGQPLVALGIGAADPLRVWPREAFAAVADYLATQSMKPVVIGGHEDADTGEYLSARGCLNATGLPSLLHSAALLRRASLFIGNDSGPMHIAAAQKVPVIEVSAFPHGGDPEAANSTTRFAPWGVPHVVLRPTAGCGIESVRPEDVIAAIVSVRS